MRTLDKRWLMALTIALPALALPATAVAQAKADMGKLEFEANCAACHGTTGKGSGPIADLLKRSPTDLTTLQSRNGGVFPMARVYETIEGAGVAEHGSRDMPIWGREYSIRAAEYFIDVPYNSEAYVRARILALAEYVSRLQAR